MRLPLKAHILFELSRSPTTLENIQRTVTYARFKEGFSWHVIRLLLRSPMTVLRAFKLIPLHRITKELTILISDNKVIYYEEGDFFALTNGEGVRSLNHWKRRRAEGPYA